MFFFWVGPRPKVSSYGWAPAPKPQAVDNFYFLFDVWDYVGYTCSWSQLHLAGPKNGKVKVITAGESLAQPGSTDPERVHRQHNNERKV